MVEMLDIHRLRLLRELSIRGTIAEVAAALRYSPSSVSQQLSLLEREAKVPLFRKSGRRLQLTAHALVLVEYAEELLAGLERAEAALAVTRPVVSGTVRLAVFQTAALALIPNMLRTLRETHPLLLVKMVQHEPETALHETWARNFDLVIAEQYPGHAAPHYESLDRDLLTRDEIQLAVPTDLTAAPEDFHRVRALEDAVGLPWVMEPHGAASRHWAQQLCRLAGFEPDIRFESADLQTHVRLVESGNAVALLPQLVWRQREQRSRLVELPGRPGRTIFTATRRSSAGDPAIAAIRQALKEEAAALGLDAPPP